MAFVRNFATLLTGTTVAQIVPLIAMPVLTRLYEPDSFGVWTLYSSVVLTGATFATLRYEMAVMLPSEDQEASALVGLSLRIAVVSAVAITAVVAVAAPSIAGLLGDSALLPWLYLAGLHVLLVASSQVLTQWFNRKVQYRGIARSRMLQAGLQSPMQAGLGALSLGPAGLILGQIIAAGGSAAYLYSKTTRQRPSNAQGRVRKRSLMRKYIRLPMLNGANAIADAVRVNGLNILVGFAFGQVALGHYGLAWRTTLMPASLINGALSQLYYQRLARTMPGKMTSMALRFAAISAGIAIVPFGVLSIFADQIFVVIFGPSWETAGVIAMKLAPWLALTFVTAPLSSVFIVTNRQGRALVWAIAAAIMPVVTVFFGGDNFLDVVGKLAMIMTAFMFVYLTLIFVTTLGFDKRRPNDIVAGAGE